MTVDHSMTRLIPAGAKRALSARGLIGSLLLLMAFLFTAHVQAKDGATGPRVRLATNMGDIVLELDAKAAPKTVENFIRYVNEKHYDGTIFHRVIDGFMIQGGGYTPDMQQKATLSPIENEAPDILARGGHAMRWAPSPWPAPKTRIRPLRSFLSTSPKTGFSTSPPKVCADTAMPLSGGWLKAWRL